MTPYPKIIRLAEPSDEQQVLGLMRDAYREQPIFPLNEDKILTIIRRCTNREGGILGVIDGPNGLRGYIIAVLSTYWYTDFWHLEELSNFVHPDHRSDKDENNWLLARPLIEFVKWFAEQMDVPLIFGILSTQRTAGKIRLYERQARPCGALFVHNTGHLENALSEHG